MVRASEHPEYVRKSAIHVGAKKTMFMQLEKFEGKEGRRWKRTTQKSWAHLMKATL